MQSTSSRKSFAPIVIGMLCIAGAVALSKKGPDRFRGLSHVTRPLQPH